MTTYLHRGGRLIIPAGTLALALFFLLLASLGLHSREQQWQHRLDTQADIQRLAVVQSQQALKRQAQMAASTLASGPDSRRLIRRIATLADQNGLDDPQLQHLRAQLAADLDGVWDIYRAAGADQLHVHLAPNGVSLLRKHRPEQWGDANAHLRPLLAQVQSTGQQGSGVEVGRYGLGMVGITPIFDQAGAVIASIEVGFGMLPELRQLDTDLEAGLAILLHAPTLTALQNESRQDALRSDDEQWLLDSYSRPEAQRWFEADQLPSDLHQSDRRVLRAGDHRFLLTRIPVHQASDGAEGERAPVAMILVWRDISDALGEHRVDQVQMAAKWLLAFIAAAALLIVFLRLSGAITRAQTLALTQRHQEALRALNDIAALPDLDSSARLQQALELGCNYLGLDIGIVSRIENERFHILAQRSPRDMFQAGAEFPLQDTLCSLVVGQKDVLDLESLSASGFKDHPAYLRAGVESYIGAPLMVAGRFYGTLSFASQTPVGRPFSELDIEFMRLSARWIGTTLARVETEREREQLLARFAKLSQHLPGMAYQYQMAPDGSAWFPFSSEGIRDIYGMTPEEAASYPGRALERIHPDDLPPLIEGIQRSADQLQRWRSEYRVLHPQFGEIWVSGNASPERLENGDIIWHGFITDITARKHMELALEQESSRLASIIESTGVGTGEWNIQTGEILFNEHWASTLGYHIEELAPVTIRTWMDLTHPDDLAESTSRLRAHFRGDTPYYQCKFRLRHRDGHWVWMHGRGKVISRSPTGEPLLMSGTHTDISEEMRLAEEIRQARSFLRAVIDASTEVAIIAIDTEDTITLFNSGAERMLGYRSEELVGQRSPMTFHLEEEVQAHARELERQLGHPVTGMEVFTARLRAGMREVRPWTYVRKDGAHRLVNLTVTRIADEHDRTIGYLGMALDISDLIETTRALRLSESRFRAMVDHLPGAVYRCQSDADWTMNYLSDGIARIAGYPATDFVDNRVRSYASIVHPDDLNLTYASAPHIQTRSSYELTYRIIHADGHEVWVRDKGQGEYDADGKLLWLSGFLWDATEQRRVDQMKSQFVSTVSHELRTPLTAISGSLALITGGAVGAAPPAMQRLLDIALRNSHSLNQLVNDLLDMERLALGNLHFALERQRLIPLLEQALELNRNYASQHQVTLVGEFNEDVWVRVDARRLGQVLTNLLSNAAKFSHPGGQVTLRADRQQDRIRLSVIDQGIGIPAEAKDQVFDRFFQVDSSDTRRRGGTGLGLAITRELVEHMGGIIGVDSELGAGSVFWCLFDILPMEES
jgi:PAS domain S-box-containing protein